MTNVEKLIAVGQRIYGDNWQSPIARALGIDSRTIRYVISGKRTINNLSARLEAAMQTEISAINDAIAIINSDRVSGDDVTIEKVKEIVDQYEYESRDARMAAIDAVNNSVYEVTYLSDLDVIAKKYSIAE